MYKLETGLFKFTNSINRYKSVLRLLETSNSTPKLLSKNASQPGLQFLASQRFYQVGTPDFSSRSKKYGHKMDRS